MPRLVVICQQCARAFQTWPSQPRVCCSRACYYAWKTVPAPIRFWRYVDRSGGPDACWPWMAYRDAHGYGNFQLSVGIWVPSHRYAYELAHGYLLPGFKVCHACDTPPCCNDGHLFPGTNWMNAHDAIRKGRYAHGTRVNTNTLEPPDILAIRALEGKASSYTVGAWYSTSPSNVVRIWRRQTWKHLP